MVKRWYCLKEIRFWEARGITEREYHPIRRTAMAHRTASAAEIQAAGGTIVTKRTVRNWLIQGHVACISLNPHHCRLRRQWCRARAHWIWNRFLETGSAGRRPGQGRRWATTLNEDRYLVLMARRHRNMNATLLQQHLRSATGTTVSTQTVRNRFQGVGLHARRPMSRFSVHPDNRRIFIWRDRGSKNNPAFVHESVRFGGGGVWVYGGISIDGRTDLSIIRDGPLTARRYRDEILRPIVVPYAAAIRDDFILMDDNCRPPRANLVDDFLFEEGIDALGGRVAGRQPPPQTLQELERALLEEWDRISQLVINSQIDSMPQRCSTLLDVRGNHFPY
ncbi:transposable element Tcb2 transposase [Trichonephila clavipes]|nr:transposable element Tcb2 transposase [Trichonephila clavipes]